MLAERELGPLSGNNEQPQAPCFGLGASDIHSVGEDINGDLGFS